MAKVFPKVLTIAGSDSSGGAGIQADLKTFAALKCYGMSALTAITAQNTQKITEIAPLKTNLIAQQIEIVLADIEINAIKIGMLFHSEIIECVFKILKKIPAIPIVLDPLMVSSTGDRLLESSSEKNILKLFPLTKVVTPNLAEASFLTQIEIDNKNSMLDAGFLLIEKGAPAVVIKGGHLSPNSGQGSDCLIEKIDEKLSVTWMETPSISTNNTHGSGCTFSAAIACGLAHSLSLSEAVKMAKSYVHGAIKAASNHKLGKGAGPLHHFYEWWT